jgi:hypothetical protein
MACKSKFLERIHQKLSPASIGTPPRLFSDLIDVVFSPNYGWSVVKLESKHFYKEWITSKIKWKF